jgi:hypothetical protein
VNENIEKVLHDLEFIQDNLSRALRKADPVEGMLVVDYMNRIASLQWEIKAFKSAIDNKEEVQG